MRASDAILERLQRLHPKLIDLALDRIERLLAALGHPEAKLPPVVHIAGTNGKGSTLAYLRAIAEALGLRVHVYTSPHLVRFAERIRIAGTIVGEEELAALLEECERANAGAPITFFEVTTAAAFLAFARHPADLCLLETGLGGAYDATNVLAKPALTLLAPIAFDHEAFLGNTLTAIAGEKAGIMKPGVPALAAAQPAEALTVFALRARELGAPLAVEDIDWQVSESAAGMRFVRKGRAIELPAPALPGAHQIGNAALAVAAAYALDEAGVLRFPLTERAIATGLTHAEWPARLQRLKRGPLLDALPRGWELWLDGGHNPAAGEALAQMARRWAKRDGRPLDLAVGMLDTKDARGFFAPFAGLARRARTVTIPAEPHAVPAEALAESARAAGLDVQAAPSLAGAAYDLGHAAAEPARLLIAGSLRLAGAVLAENG